jgi:hypothetical protein
MSSACDEERRFNWPSRKRRFPTGARGSESAKSPIDQWQGATYSVRVRSWHLDGASTAQAFVRQWPTVAVYCAG